MDTPVSKWVLIVLGLRFMFAEHSLAGTKQVCARVLSRCLLGLKVMVAFKSPQETGPKFNRTRTMEDDQRSGG